MNSQHIVKKFSFWKAELFNIVSWSRCKRLPAANKKHKRQWEDNRTTNLTNHTYLIILQEPTDIKHILFGMLGHCTNRFFMVSES